MAVLGLGLVLLAVLVAVGGGLGLFVLVREEAADREVLSREAAERAARRDTSEDR